MKTRVTRADSNTRKKWRQSKQRPPEEKIPSTRTQAGAYKSSRGAAADSQSQSSDICQVTQSCGELNNKGQQIPALFTQAGWALWDKGRGGLLWTCWKYCFIANWMAAQFSSRDRPKQIVLFCSPTHCKPPLISFWKKKTHPHLWAGIQEIPEVISCLLIYLHSLSVFCWSINQAASEKKHWFVIIPEEIQLGKRPTLGKVMSLFHSLQRWTACTQSLWDVRPVLRAAAQMLFYLNHSPAASSGFPSLTEPMKRRWYGSRLPLSPLLLHQLSLAFLQFVKLTSASQS